MNKIKLNLLSSNFLVFVAVIAIVVYLQHDLLKPTLELGLTPDDWSFILFYKLLGPFPLTKILKVWPESGPYTTIPLYYTGIINSIVGFNYLNLQIVGILFKILATLVLFPLVLTVFKNRLLAFFTVIIFAMSYPSTGALETAVEPSEYLGMLSMGLFLIFYYHFVQKHLLTWKWLSLTTLMFIITVLLSVMRLYPLFMLMPLVEIYLWAQRPSKAALKDSLLRLISLFSPFLLITIYSPSVILNYIGSVPAVLLKVLEGNWHLSLVPLQGLGSTIPSSAAWGLLGLIRIGSLNEYLSFILGGPMVVFGLIILFLAFLTSTKPWKFFILGCSLNIFLEILIFFIATHFLSIPLGQRINFDSPRIYSTLVGLFILILAFVYWIEWYNTDRNNNLFLALWVGPAVSFLFILLTWIFSDINLGFGGAQDHYLLIPTAGTSIFIATVLVLTYKKFREIKSRLFKVILVSFIFITLAGFYLLNRNLIYSYFNYANANGRAASGQIMIQSKFREKVKDIDFSKPALFYFDTSDISGEGRFYTESFLSSFPFWMHFEGNKLINGCIELLYSNEHKQLLQFIKVENEEKGFFFRSLCVENEKGGYKEILHKRENFYAFKLKNRDFIDIKEEVLKELGF